MTAISWRDVGVPTSPLVAPDGTLRPEWRSFFTSLYLRTGGSQGQETDTAHLQAQLVAEAATRAAADVALGTGINNEAALRSAGDLATQQAAVALVADEAVARVQGDQTVSRTVYNETQARIAADALLVPRAELCSLWAGCDLSFLPTADPGAGKPWLDGIHVAVGTAAGSMTGIGLEDASGAWAREDGSGAWLYG
jgi:hypothetical protein